MSPMEKMDEIVRALEEIAPGPCTCLPYATEGSPEECASCNNARHVARALTLARELRDGAVEGWVHPDSTGLVHSYTSADFFLDRPHNQYCAALLILSDPTP